MHVIWTMEKVYSIYTAAAQWRRRAFLTVIDPSETQEPRPTVYSKYHVSERQLSFRDVKQNTDSKNEQSAQSLTDFRMSAPCSNNETLRTCTGITIVLGSKAISYGFHRGGYGKGDTSFHSIESVLWRDASPLHRGAAESKLQKMLENQKNYDKEAIMCLLHQSITDHRCMHSAVPRRTSLLVATTPSSLDHQPSNYEIHPADNLELPFGRLPKFLLAK